MHTVGQLITKSTEYLDGKGVDSPRLDAELLLARVLGCDRLRLYMDWYKPLMELEVAAYRDLIRQRGQNRVPVARLLEHKEFYGRDFIVTQDTFVPRPETEGLVERALALLDSEPALQVERPQVFEVGTGTGCISVTMAAENAGPHYIASDISEGALATAKRNAAAHHVESRIEFRHGAGFCGFQGALHLLVSNPPYVKTGEIAELDPEVRVHDPHAALDGGEDGLEMVRGLIADARRLLVPGGCVILELGEDHEPGILDIFRHAGLADGKMHRDYEGKPRYAFARKKVE